MSEAVIPLGRALRGVVQSQCLATAAVALAFGWMHASLAVALAALYGGATAVASAWWLGRGLAAAGTRDSDSARRTLYRGAVQRFVFTVAAFALGMGLLGLAPLPLLIAYGACQLGYVLGARG